MEVEGENHAAAHAALSHGAHLGCARSAVSAGGLVHRRGLPRTGSIHAGLNRGGARQWDLKSRFLNLLGAGLVQDVDAVLEEEDEACDDECGGGSSAETSLPMRSAVRKLEIEDRPSSRRIAGQHMHLQTRGHPKSRPLPNSPLCALNRPVLLDQPHAHADVAIPCHAEGVRQTPFLGTRTPVTPAPLPYSCGLHTGISVPVESTGLQSLRKRAADVDDSSVSDLMSIRQKFKRFTLSAPSRAPGQLAESMGL
jgi:hypothetical protein